MSPEYMRSSSPILHAMLSSAFDKMCSTSWDREDIGSQAGFEAIQFNSDDGCLLKGWVYKSPGQKNDRGTCFLLHGVTTNSSSLVETARILSKEYNMTVVGYDQRYHGWSSRSPFYPTFGCYEARDAQAAIDFAEKSGLPDPYILHGNSLGGMAAQRAGIKDGRVKGLLLLMTPGWPWHAIGKCAWDGKPLGPIFIPFVNLLNAAYGWDVLSDGDIRRHKQDPKHRPLVCSIMGDRDSYDIGKTKDVFQHWHNGEPAEFDKLPSETPDCKKFFTTVEGACHSSDTDGIFIWDWEGFKRLERDFYESVLGEKRLP